MKQPACVLWALTKKNNAHLVKFNRNQWSSNPLNTTGFHCASQDASSVSVGAARHNTKKGFGVHYIVKQAHAQHQGRKKICKSGLVMSDVRTTSVKHAVKAINGMQHASQKSKDMALRRLARQAAANRKDVKKHA